MGDTAISPSDIKVNKTDQSFTAYYVADGCRAAAELTEMGGYWYFNRLIVHNKLRNKKLGGLLIDKVISWATEEGQTIQCDVNAYGDLNTEELTAFYIKRGFIPLFEGCLYFGDKQKLPLGLLELFSSMNVEEDE